MGCGATAPGEASASEVAALEEAAGRCRDAVSAPLALKADGSLQILVQQGCVRSDVGSRRVTVSVSYTGDVAALRAAGFDLGYDDGQSVTAILAVRDLNALAALECVVAIEMQPEVTLDSPSAERNR